MSKEEDFFFSSYPTIQQRRLAAALQAGLAHGSRIEPADPLPGEAVTALFSSRITSAIAHVAVYYTTDGSVPQGEQGRPSHGDVVMAQPQSQTADSSGTVQQWKAVLPAQAEGTLVRYSADGWSEDETHSWRADSADPVSIPVTSGRIFAYHVDRWTTPDWWHDAIVYQLIVDRFSSAHDEPPLLAHDAVRITDFFGGTLRGVEEKLDYIQQLGVNCLWFTPFIESPTHHGYNATDYYTVARRYGTNEQLKHLVQAIHARGMRVLFDLAANHTSNEHPALLDALNNPNSPTRDWYNITDVKGNGYQSYASQQNMPELKTDNPQVQAYLNAVALYWLQELGADGLRLDYVQGPSHAFWTIFQQAIKTHCPQAITLGEITAPLNEIAIYAGRLDAYMDFPLTHMLRQVFATRNATVSDLLIYLQARQGELPAHMDRATLLDNHDMHRFLWLAEGHKDRLRLAAACHLTLDGTPIIYYGSEVGLSQYDDAYKENAYARAPMLWGEQQDHDLYAYYRRLLTLRQQEPALRRGALQPVAVQILAPHTEQEAAQVGAYLRWLDERYFLVILNNNERELELSIDLQQALQAKSTLQATSKGVPVQQREQSLQDVLREKSVAVEEGRLHCTVAAISAQILANKA